MQIVKTTIGFRGPSGALDLDMVILATGAPGSEVTYDDNILTLPRGDKGDKGDKGDDGDKGDPGDKGDRGDNARITTFADPAAWAAYAPAANELAVLTNA